MEAKPLNISFNEKDVFIKIYDGIRYLVLINYGWFDKNCDRIKYIVSKKCRITQIVLIIILELPELVHIIPFKILIKSVVNKDKNNYYYKIFLEIF